MSSTHDLLEMIAALKQRLELARAHSAEVGSADTRARENPGIVERTQQLRHQLTAGVAAQQVVHLTLQQAEATPGGEGAAALPAHLTARALRLVGEARDLLARLRTLGGRGLLSAGEGQPAGAFYRDTVQLAELVLRAIQTLPTQAGLQTRLACGIDVLLAQIGQRTAILEGILEQDRGEEMQLGELCRLLRQLRQGTLVDWNPFFTLAEDIVQEASAGRPLRFVSHSPAEPVRFVAAHSLTVARVVARAARTHAEWCSRLLQPVVAALVHDAGMLALPSDLLAQPRTPNTEQWLLLERHCQLGARWASRVQPAHPWLVEALRNHHERLDGLGYPAGLKGPAIEPLVQLLSACDVYAALCCPRPHRTALDTAAALNEVVTMAARGALGQQFVGMLQELSPYPAGRAVALQDGSCGVVIAVSPGPRGSNATLPVVLLLADRQGRAMPFPQVIDLAFCDNRTVSRNLSPEERRQLFGNSYPQWA